MHIHLTFKTVAIVNIRIYRCSRSSWLSQTESESERGLAREL